MTNKEALDIIDTAIAEIEWEYPVDYSAALEVAKEALEMRIPIKPKIEDIPNDCIYAYCPNCGEVVYSLLKNFEIESEYNHSYCGGCGQAIDWEA